MLDSSAESATGSFGMLALLSLGEQADINMVVVMVASKIDKPFFIVVPVNNVFG